MIALIGMKAVRASMKEASNLCRGAVGAALYQEGLGIMMGALRLVPVDTGRLRATGYVAPPKEGPGGPTVELGFGTKYAVYVHERTDLNHPVGEAKYLQTPLEKAKSGYVRRIAMRARDNIKSGTLMGITKATGL